MKKVLFLSNATFAVFLFRRELIERLLKEENEVWILSAYDERVQDLEALGCHHRNIEINRHGTNPFEELRLMHQFKKSIREIGPDIVFSYTIKPNIYGAIACRSLGIPCLVNISGLGTAVENSGLLQFITVTLYRFAFTKVKKIYFQNTENMKFFADRKIAPGRYKLLPGSGVNLEWFHLLEYPDDRTIEFAYIARVMKEKGIDQYLAAAKIIKEKYPNTRFHVCGFCEEEYHGELRELQEKNVIEYHGMVNDIREILKNIHCVVHPTYYPEGMSNTLLEACASGRPIITTDRSGCREILEDGVNGYVVRQKDTQSLVDAIERFIGLSNEERRQMGLAGRAKVEKEFDRQIVVDTYMAEMEKI